MARSLSYTQITKDLAVAMPSLNHEEPVEIIFMNKLTTKQTTSL